MSKKSKSTHIVSLLRMNQVRACIFQSLETLLSLNLGLFSGDLVDLRPWYLLASVWTITVSYGFGCVIFDCQSTFFCKCCVSY